MLQQPSGTRDVEPHISLSSGAKHRPEVKSDPGPLQEKAAFFCFWEIREIPENTAGDIVCLTEQASARLLLNDINRIFSDFEQWEQELDRSPYTEEGIREMLKTAKKKMRGRISLTDIYLNYVMYNTNIRTFSPGNSRSSSKITDEEEILDLLDDPQFYQYCK